MKYLQTFENYTSSSISKGAMIEHENEERKRLIRKLEKEEEERENEKDEEIDINKVVLKTQ